MKERILLFVSSIAGYLYSIRNFFRKLHPVVITLFLMLMVSVPVTLVMSIKNQGVNRENKKDIEDFFKENPVSAIAYDILVKTPVKEEFKYRGPVAIISLLKLIPFFKPIITFQNPLVWFLIIFPGIDWSQSHAVPWATLIDSLLLGWLVFKIGGIRGWLASLLVHELINLAVFIGFCVNHFLIK